MTLVELMMVVAIIGILAAVASVGYRKYIGKARISEAVAMLAEMTSKEVMYYSEFASYYPLRSDNNATMPSPNEAATAFAPISASSTLLESARTSFTIEPSAYPWPNGWRFIGLRPKQNSVYCTYLVNAGPVGTVPPGGSVGRAMLPNPVAATTPPWFYALAACNLAGPGGFPNAVTVLGLTSDSPSLRTINDGL